MTTVSAVKAESYDTQVVEQAMDELLGLIGGMEQYVKPGEKVLIKPNMLEGLSPEKAVTTHPEVVRAVIKAVKAAGAVPVVGDSPAMGNTLKAAQKTGILAICQEEGIQLLPFQHAIDIPFPAGTMVKKLALAQELQAVDKVISLGKMKTHSLTGVTGGIKNLFGFVVGPNKAQFHLRMQQRSDFAAMLVDLAQAVNPVLFIIDGIVGMEGDGPRNGTPCKGNILLAGTNGFAVDMVMAEMMGFRGDKLPVAAQALRQGLVPLRAEITVTGSAQNTRLSFREPKNMSALDTVLPKWLAAWGQQQLTAKPVIAPNCVGCRRCAEHCPPQAITLINNQASIDYARCIRCYCCQELCPHNAVNLKDGTLLNAILKLRGRK